MNNKLVKAGTLIEKAKKVLIMLHGRGGSANDILSFADHLQLEDFALLAPEAADNSWYPHSFMAPAKQNEPKLSQALQAVADTVAYAEQQGIARENIYMLGFSQGACLTSEYMARNAAGFGGAIIFTGGVIGDKIDRSNYKGDFGGMPVFIGTSDPDMHVPVERVYATTNILKEMGAAVTEKVYPGMGHTINEEEIELARSLVLNK